MVVFDAGARVVLALGAVRVGARGGVDAFDGDVEVELENHGAVSRFIGAGGWAVAAVRRRSRLVGSGRYCVAIQ